VQVKKEKAAKRDEHPLMDAAAVSEQETREFFREVAALVRYADFSEYPWEQFRSYKRLAMLDLWSGLAEEEKVRRSEVDPAEIQAARESELYARIRYVLTEAFREVAEPKDPEQWVKSMQDASFRKLARIARHAVDPRIAAAAARDFADRALPKVSRNNDQDGGAPVLMITEDGARLLMTALETVRRKAEEAARQLPEAT
jgi:hypothetical protein